MKSKTSDKAVTSSTVGFAILNSTNRPSLSFVTFARPLPATKHAAAKALKYRNRAGIKPMDSEAVMQSGYYSAAIPCRFAGGQSRLGPWRLSHERAN